jgi:Fic family protein
VAALKAVGGLPGPAKADKIWRDIWFHEAHNSTAIEGNTLVLKQVEALLARGETVGNKELKEYLEVKGYADAATWVYGQARKARARGAPLLTLQEVRQVHHTAMTPVWAVAPHPDATPEESPGNFRKHDIHPFPSKMTPPTHPLIAAEMRGWLERVNRVQDGDGFLSDRLAELHAGFERAHPFIDGNGRTGRLLLNLLLVRLGYPPAVIQKRERVAYLKALARSDRGEHAPLGEQIARAVLDSLMRFLLPAIAGTVKLVALDALLDKDLSIAALRQAAERGRLRAVKDESGSWRSSRRWVSEYKKTRYAGLKSPRGPRLRA